MKAKLGTRVSWIIVLATIAALALPLVALADNVVNDVTVEGSDTFVAPGSTVVSYKVNATGGDGQTGCNASDGSPATVTLNVPDGVSASSTSLTFANCNAPQSVTFSSSTPGEYAIGVADISDSGAGAYKNEADFTLHVNAPPNTPPSVSIGGVEDGASYEIGSVPAATCEVTDAEDGNSSVAATLSDITGDLAAFGLGAQTASCSYTDAGGLTAEASATYAIVDTTAPTITFVSRTEANANGWNNGDVTVTWSCSDSGSGAAAETVSETLSAEGADQSVTGTCEDHAGNKVSDTQTGINIDRTAPATSASVSPEANANGWYNVDVTVSITGTDDLSGIDACDADVVLSDEGADQSASGTCTDKAGNAGVATATGINIDKTAPVATASAAPEANANGWNNSDVTVSFSGSDELSGIDFCDAAVVLSDEGADQSASGACTDKAGNASAAATAAGIDIDKTAPSVALAGGPADGASYYFGSVPEAPTCSASDALSGLDGDCSVTGYSTLVGEHTVTASAADLAGNTASASATYTVLPWSFAGFFRPVDMDGEYNVIKGGSTVPLKFQVFAGPAELTDTSAVKSFVQTKIACDGTSPVDDEEFSTTGRTGLRYDAGAGQFIQNWKAPKLPGQCYAVTMTTQDGSSLVAYFKLK